MRISVFPKGDLDAIIKRDLTVFDWIEMSKALSAEGLELHSAMFWETTDIFVDTLAAAIIDSGKEMPMLCVSPDFTNPDPAIRRSDRDREEELIRAAHRITGPGVAVRVLSGQAHPGVSIDQGLEWAAECIRYLLPLAAELDVTLALENHYKDGAWAYPEFAQKADVYIELLDRVGDNPHFGVQYDPSNAIVAGENSADFLDRVIDRVVTMQASDRSKITESGQLSTFFGTTHEPAATQFLVLRWPSIHQGTGECPRAMVGFPYWASIRIPSKKSDSA